MRQFGMITDYDTVTRWWLGETKPRKPWTAAQVKGGVPKPTAK